MKIMGNTIKILTVIAALAWMSNVPSVSEAATDIHYMVHDGAGAKTGVDLANAFGETEFNTIGNWDTDEADDNLIGPGDTVYFYDDTGDFVQTSGTFVLQAQRTGAIGTPITFKAYPGETPVIDGEDTYNDCFYTNALSYLVIDGITTKDCLDYGFRLRTTSNTTVQNCTAYNIGTVHDESAAHGVLIINGSDNTIQNNLIYNCATKGIHINANGGSSDDNILQNNTIRDCWYNAIDMLIIDAETNDTIDNTIIRRNHIYWTTADDTANGIYINSGDADATPDHIRNTKIYNNIISACPQYSIQVNSLYEDVYIWNNTIYNSAAVDVYFNDDAGVAEVKNNIGYSGVAINHHVRLFGDAPSNKTFDDNIWYGGAYIAQIGSAFDDIGLTEWNLFPDLVYTGVTVGTDLNSDPVFHTTGTNFHLQSTSPAISIGTNVGLTVDYDSVPLPQGAGYDTGAFEYIDWALRGATLNGALLP